MDAIISFGIITVSDRCYAKEKVDVSGPKLAAEITKCFSKATITFKKIVPDSQQIIENTLSDCIFSRVCDVIFTTGGTGFSPRDVTPEATRNVIEKEAPALAYAMLSKSLQITEMAMLSRAVCGIADKTIVINLPGSAKGAVECFGFVKSVLPHAVSLVTDIKETIEKDHKEIQKSENAQFSAQKQLGLKDTQSKVRVKVGATRNRKSPYPMVEVSDATSLILRECTPTVGIDIIPFEEAFQRVLAEDIIASEPIPPFPASIKDGYAVIASDGAGERIVKDASAAGDEPDRTAVKPGEAIRISTGAPLPSGADAVVQIEDTTIVKVSDDGEKEEIINILVAPVKGQDIRAIGSDIAANTVVLEKFDSITAAHVGVLAMLGRTFVKVFKKPAIGIISTGNELRGPRETLKPGQIRDSNKITLINLLKRYGFNAVDCGIAQDKPNSVKRTLESAFEKNDIIISSGGVSMGEYDLLKQVLVEDFDAIIHFGRVNMKPGKPTTFATLTYQSKLRMVFALPGNPVSCSVTTLLFVVPTLRFLERNKNYKFPVTQACLGNSIENPDERPDYVRVEVAVNPLGGLRAVSTGNQISSRLNSMIGANGLLILPGKTKKTCNNNYYTTILVDELVND